MANQETTTAKIITNQTNGTKRKLVVEIETSDRAVRLAEFISEENPDALQDAATFVVAGIEGYISAARRVIQVGAKEIGRQTQAGAGSSKSGKGKNGRAKTEKPADAHKGPGKLGLVTHSTGEPKAVNE